MKKRKKKISFFFTIFLIISTFMAGAVKQPKSFFINPLTSCPDYFLDVSEFTLGELSDVQFTGLSTGAIIYRNAAGKWVILPLGIVGTYLRSTGTLPAYSAILAGDLPSAIDAAKIANGNVSNTEYQYLDGVTSAIQTQFSGKEPTITAGTSGQYWRGDKSWQTLDKSAVGLGSVENTALSTWAGTANITTLGTVGTGAWNATAIADGKIASALTGKTYNGITPTALATGFSLAGGTTSKTLTVELDSSVNQDLRTTASPTFAGQTLSSAGRNLKTWWNFEDFIFGSGTSGLGAWRPTTSGSGAAIAPTATSNLRLGIERLTTGSEATGRTTIHQTAHFVEFLFGAGIYTIEADINITTLSDGTDTYALRFGFGDSVSGAPTDGAYFRYVSTTSANWFMCTASNDAITATDTGVAAVAGAWTRLKAVVNADATSVEYFINGVSVGTVTTNIPTGAGRNAGAILSIVKSAGTTARTVDIDWAWIHVELVTSR